MNLAGMSFIETTVSLVISETIDTVAETEAGEKKKDTVTNVTNTSEHFIMAILNLVICLRKLKSI